MEGRSGEVVEKEGGKGLVEMGGERGRCWRGKVVELEKRRKRNRRKEKEWKEMEVEERWMRGRRRIWWWGKQEEKEGAEEKCKGDGA